MTAFYRRKRTPDTYLIQKVGTRYWLSKCGWRQGSFPTLDAAVREHQMRRRMDRKALR